MDSQTEVRYLFNKLNSWREISQREFSSIINSHSKSISKGVNELIEEVCDLKTKLSIITEERNDLLDKVDNLSGEINQLREKLPRLQTLQDPLENIGLCKGEGGIPETDDKGEHIDCETVRENQQYTSNNEKNLHDSILKELADKDFGNIEPLKSDKDVTEGNVIEDEKQEEILRGRNGEMPRKSSPDKCFQSKRNMEKLPENAIYFEDFICPQCQCPFSTSENLSFHLKNMHPKEGIKQAEGKVLKDQDDHLGIAEDKVKHEAKLKCEHCPYKTPQIKEMKRHIKRVHEKIRNHVCDKCGYAASQKHHLKSHNESVHNMGDKKFKCEKCPHETTKKSNLKVHIKTVHEKIRDHVCEECGFAALQKRHLAQHIKGVHKKIRNHPCGQCDFAASQKSNLKNHLEMVHKIKDKQKSMK